MYVKVSEKIQHQNWWDTAKALLKGKLILEISYTRKRRTTRPSVSLQEQK